MKIFILILALLLTLTSCENKKAIVNYKTPYTSNRVLSDIGKLKRKYPDIIETDVIGFSVKNKKIPLVTLGKGKKRVLIVAGLHSREYLTVAFAMRAIEEYAMSAANSEKYGNYDIKKILENYTLYFVPMSNPDGLDIVTANELALYDGKAKTEIYKRNANGVNLNRNFPFYWSEVSDGSDLSMENYKGAHSASEPETKALMALCENNSFEWMMSVHLRGGNIFWRDTKNGEITGDERIADILNEACSYIKSNVTESPENFGGGFENWFRSRFRKPAFCVELVDVDRNYNYELSRTKDFDYITKWNKTKYTFIAPCEI